MNRGLDSLLNNKTFCFESYIEKQEKFIGQPIYVKVIYRRKLRNIETRTLSYDLMNKLFVTLTSDNLENPCNWLHKFNPKDTTANQFYFNPLIISPNSLLKFEIMDKINNPTVCHELFKEIVGHRPNLMNFRNSNFKTFLAEPEACKIFNSQGHFFIKITGFENPELPGDYTDVFTRIEKHKEKNISEISDKLEKIKNHLIKEDRKKDKKQQKIKNDNLIKISKIEDRFKSKFLNQDELITYPIILQDLSYEIYKFWKDFYKPLFNIEAREERSKKYVESLLTIEPTIEMKTFYMTSCRSEHQLSRYKENTHNRKEKVKNNETT